MNRSWYRVFVIEHSLLVALGNSFVHTLQIQIMLLATFFFNNNNRLARSMDFIPEHYVTLMDIR